MKKSRDGALKWLLQIPGNIVQSLLNFRVFLLADKGQKGENSAGSFVHFKTLQDASPEFLEQTISFTFWLQKISFPDDPDQPNPQNRFYGTNYIPAPEPQEWLWTPVACVCGQSDTNMS